MFKALSQAPVKGVFQNGPRVQLRVSKRYLSLHEHQAQNLLAKYGVKVPVGYAAASTSEVGQAISKLGGNAVLKSQILAGGRGKGKFGNGLKSGVHIVSSVQDGKKLADQMLGQNLITKQTSPEGLPVNTLYVTEKIDIEDEYYLAFTISREHYAPVLLMCRGGGTGIEELAAEKPEEVVNIPLKYSQGITDEIVSIVCQKLALDPSRQGEVKALLSNLYRVFQERDATLLEINPLVQDRKSGKLLCADTKLTVDNAAKHRQSEAFQLRDFSQEKAIELEAEKHGLVYIQLEGNIGCLVNGAGLAMATNDAVAHYGGACANFLDGGGQATKETMVKAFELILSDPNVTTILVNIYGGIIRCDMIAESIIAAAQEVGEVPVVVRLQGTNSEKGQQMIADSGLRLFAETEFDGAMRKAIELASREKSRSSTPSTSQASLGSRTDIRSYATISTRNVSSTASKARPLFAGSVKNHHRTYATASASYKDTISNLAINKDTRVMYQGFTGKAASMNAQHAIKYGTNIVGGVSRSIKSDTVPHPEPALASLPVYKSVRQAMQEIRPDATAVFVPAVFAAEAITEAIEAEIPLIVSVAEHIPVHDMLRVQEILRTQSKSRLVGPNCPGIISPLHACKIGIMPHSQYAPGVIGIVSKSGTLSYEAVGSTTKAGLGQSLCVGVGGDLLPGTALVDAVAAMISDPSTKGIVLLGEIGGDAEIQASALLKEYRDAEIKAGRKPKPVVGMVTGRTAPKGRTMGHAGAISGGSSVTAEDKIRAMEEAGVAIPIHPGEIGPIMKRLLAEKQRN